MSYSKTIDYLYNLQKYGIKFGLDNISRLMSALNNPYKSFLSVHVAGTNGKGSTSAIISSVLKTAGLKVGLFTSPHIVSFTGRIRVNGEKITEKEVIRLAGEVRDIIARIGDFTPTFFEVVTAMALLYFKTKKIDIAVIEVGMGGRLDATNIIAPEVSVITNISYDHREFLGDTLKEIANEKAGIIKRGVPVVVSCQEPEAMTVIEQKAAEKNVELYVYGRDFYSVLKREDISGICFDYQGDNSFTIHDLFLPLSGEHQMQNASIAIKAATILLKSIGHKARGNGHGARGMWQKSRIQDKCTIHDASGSVCHDVSEFQNLDFIREGLEDVKWPGRLEIVKEDPPILIDGAHNPAAAVALSKALAKNFLGRYKRIILVLGIMGDKDIRGVMEPLLPLASEIILTSTAYTRSASPEKLAGIAASLGFFGVRTAPTVKDAIEMAIKIGAGVMDHGSNAPDNQCNPLPPSPRPLPLLLITGSFYTIGEAKEAIGIKGVLTRLRE